MDPDPKETPPMTMLPGARKDEQKISPDWQLVRDAIDGVHFQEVRHVPRQ